MNAAEPVREEGSIERTGPQASQGQEPAAVVEPAQPVVPAQPAPETRDLASLRDTLTERFALLQAELGGLFYEMAIRDHLQLDLLIERAATLQRVEEELHAVERKIRAEVE